MIFQQPIEPVQGYEPVAAEWQPHVGNSGPQFWCRVALDPDGTLLAVSWTGGDQNSNGTYVRLFDGDDLSPITSNKQCNTTTTAQQDENEVSIEPNGSVLVAWSDRSSTYTDYMNANGRILSSAGSFTTNEFSLADLVTGHETDASKWRPLLHPLLSGGSWVGCWTSGWGEDAIGGLIGDDGSLISGDVVLHAYPLNNSQSYVDCCEVEDGIWFVWEDETGPDAKNIWMRKWEKGLSAPITSTAHCLPSAFRAGDQREPRIAATGTGVGNLVLVYQSAADSVSPRDVLQRLFDLDGTPLGDPEVLNSWTTGHQRDPQVEMASNGTYVVVWSDEHSSQNCIRAAYYDIDGDRIGDEWVVNSLPLGSLGVPARRTPSLAMTRDGSRLFFGWSRRSGGTGTNPDCVVREYVGVP